MKQFGELDEDVAQMCKYAKWKTTDIMKALKEGRKPQPGPPGGEDDDGFGDMGGDMGGGGGAGGGGGGGGGLAEPAAPPAAAFPPAAPTGQPVAPAGGMPGLPPAAPTGQPVAPAGGMPQPVVHVAPQPVVPQYIPGPAAVPVVVAPGGSSAGPGNVNVEDALELAKFAVRALEMRDKATARDYLNRASQALQ